MVPLRKPRRFSGNVFAAHLAVQRLGQTDNFDDGDDAGWSHAEVLAPFGGTTTYSFPSGPFGKGYRIQCSSSADLVGMCGDCGTARTYVYRTNVYTDFFVATDLINWDNSLDQALVIGARVTSLGLGTANGYVCNYDCNQDGAGPGDRRGGEFQINRVDGESPTTIASAEVTLVAGKAYRVTFKGVGTLLTGQLYDLEDLSAPLVAIQADDAAYTTGVSGLISYSRDATVSDVTFDNYVAAVADPDADVAPAIRHPVPGTPQVVTRTPANRFDNFHLPSSGISFTAQTFSTDQINSGATKLFLNGVDVSSALAPFPANGTTASFSAAAGTLADNTFYAARIELQDTTGALKTTNTFWFDTFTDSFLTNSPVKTIEVEDYNYSNGLYQLDPVQLSGYDTNGVQVNGNGGGYLNLDGTPEVDYHDNRTSPEFGWNDYRVDDFVGTLQGNREDIQDLNHPAPTTPPWADPARPNDHTRHKYAALSMKEYEVARTEAGEWLNYTRVFADTNYYVLLRCGSFGVQDVKLDLVRGDPKTNNQTTTPLGTFSVPNHLMRLNYRYEPLLVSGVPVVVHLAGTNTIRLTMGGTPIKDNQLLFLNYLLFVPTSAGPTVFDNFNDGDDTNPPPAWLRYDPIGTLLGSPNGTWSFPGGNTYRIQAAASPDPAHLGQGRAGGLQPGGYTDFYVSADVVGWDDSIHQVFGLLARVSNLGPGGTAGYLFSYDRGNPTNATGGDMDIVRLDSENPTSLPTSPSGGDSVHFQSNKQYRLVFIGAGNNFTGQVYELPNTSTPVVDITASDPAYASGEAGLTVANNASESGYDGPADATFDNFLATTAEPRLSVNLSAGAVTLSWPLIPFKLQSSPSLGPPDWTSITNGITQAASRNVYTVPSPAGAQFYRLIYP